MYFAVGSSPKGILDDCLRVLYADYCKEWIEDHDYIEGDSEPVCFCEWYDNEFQFMLEEMEESCWKKWRKSPNE